MSWIDVESAATLQSSGRILCEVDGYSVQVLHIAGTYYAFEDRCTHDDAPLDDAAIDGTEVVCPRHGARFCLRTGAALSPPAYEPLRLFEVRERDDRIEIWASP